MVIVAGLGCIKVLTKRLINSFDCDYFRVLSGNAGYEAYIPVAHFRDRSYFLG